MSRNGRTPIDRSLARRRARRTIPRAGLSLLEIILAIGVLGLSLAAIFESVRSAVICSRTASELTQAQLLCESKMAEIETGILELETVSEAAFDDVLDTQVAGGENETAAPDRWLYSISVSQLDDHGLSEVRVVVWRNLAEEQKPTTFELVRWMIDEEIAAQYVESLEAAEEDASGSTATDMTDSSGEEPPEGGGP